MFGHPPESLHWIVFLVMSSSCRAADDPSNTTAASESSSSASSDDTAPDDKATDSAGTSSGGAAESSTGSESACTPSGVLEADATRTVEAASVTTSATLLNALEHCAKDELAFRLVLDTHTVDLLAYDMIAEAYVDTSNGTTVAEGFVWDGGSESSHHRDGILRVVAPPLAGAEWLRLTLPGVAGVDRTFEWDSELLAHDLP